MRGFVSLVVLALPALACLGWAADESITADLKTCKFKVAANIAELFGYSEDKAGLFFYTNGIGEVQVKIPSDGEYDVVIKASGDAAQNEQAKFRVLADGQPVGKETTLSSDLPREYKFTAKLKAGDRTIGLEFTNDVFKEGEYDRNLYVHSLTLKKK